MIPMMTIHRLAAQLSRLADDVRIDKPLFDEFYEFFFDLELETRRIDALPSDELEAARAKRIAGLRRKYRKVEPYRHLLDIMESVVCRDVEALEPFVSGKWKKEE